MSHWVTVFNKKNVCHTDSLCLRKNWSKTVKNCQKLSKMVKNGPFVTVFDSFRPFLTVFVRFWPFLTVFEIFDSFYSSWPFLLFLTFLIVSKPYLTIYRKYKLMDDGWCKKVQKVYIDGWWGWKKVQKVQKVQKIFWQDILMRYFDETFWQDILMRHIDGLWKPLMTCNDLWYGDDFIGMALWQFWLSLVI